MFIIAACIAGFAFGWIRAARRGGVLADKIQYGCIFAILFCLASLALIALAFDIGYLEIIPAEPVSPDPA